MTSSSSASSDPKSAILAAAFENARREHETNEKLRRSVLEAIEQSVRITAAGSAAKRRQEASKFIQREQEQLQEFEKMCSFRHMRRVNPARLMEDAQLRVPLAQLVQPGARGKPDALARTGDALLRLKKLKHTPAVLSTFADKGIKSIDTCVSMLREAALDGNVWGNLPDSLLVLLEEVISLPATETLLDEDMEAIRRMAFSIEEMSQQQEQAVADGDMKLVETLYFKKITVQEAMVDIYNRMYSQLDEHFKESVVDPLKRVQQVHQSTNGAIQACMAQNDQRKQSVEADLAALKHLQESLTEEGKVAEKKWTQLKSQSDAYLKENASCISQCYAAMEELEKQLAKLAAERQEAIQKRLFATDEEERRRSDLANFEIFFKQHRALLETTLHTIDVAEEVTDLVDELVCNGCNALEQRMRDVDAAVEVERQKVHDSRLSHFRQLYLTLGDLQYKKERHMEELDKKIEQVHIQQEMAMDTFNPKAKEYSQMKKELLKVREEMQSQVQVLSDKAVLQIEAFKPTEVALIDSGKQFTHPVEELAQRNRQRQQKMLEYHSLMSAETTTADGIPAKSEEAIRQEKEEIEQLKLAAMSLPRRPLQSRGGGGGTGGSPTKAIM